jgi:ketosteroid isomerase-like protein
MSEENVEMYRCSRKPLIAATRHPGSKPGTRTTRSSPATSGPKGDVRGREAAWDFYVTVADTFERQPFSDDIEVIDAGADKVVVHQRNDVRGGESGVNVVLDYWIVVSFRDGKIFRDQWFENREEALEAAGLRE